MSIIVLSGKHTDTAAFKKQAGLPTTVRHIVNRDSLPPFARTLHVLPSFYDRRDVHAVEAQLRRLSRKVPGGLKRLEWGWDRENRVFFQHVEESGVEPVVFVAPDAVVIEPPGFELSDDPEVQAQQILDSAAGVAREGAIIVGETDDEAAARADAEADGDVVLAEEPWMTREQVAEETGAEGDDLLELLGELDS